MFSEQYPIQAFQTSLGQQGTYPISSPMALLKADRPGIKLVQLPVDHYCMKIEYEGKEFYQVAAIGFEN
jgi:glyoxylate carboligase